MRRICILLILVPFLAVSQDLREPKVAWSTLAGGSGQEQINDIAESPTGHIAAIGYTTSKSNKQEDQYYLILNADGKKISDHNYGSMQHDRGLGITTTQDGHFIYCGYVQVPDPKMATVFHKTPNLRLLDPAGKTKFSVIESGIVGFYTDLVEVGSWNFMVIGEDRGKAILAFYQKQKLIWKKEISGTGIVPQKIIAVTDSTFLLTGQDHDKLLWYALYDMYGDQIWSKKGIKNYGQGKSLVLENKEIAWIGGSYYDSRKREDAYLLKIKIQDGSILVKNNFGDTYDDILSSISMGQDSTIYIAGKTFSHMRAGARRSKAWLLEVDPISLKLKSDPYIWGGTQNNQITSSLVTQTGHLVLGGWTASGEAEGTDAWVQELPNAMGDGNFMVPGIALKDFMVLDENNDGKIGYTEASTIQLEYSKSSTRIAGLPYCEVYLNSQKVGYTVLFDHLKENKMTIPYYRLFDLSGIYTIKIVLFDGRHHRLDSIEKTIEFLPKDAVMLDILFDQAVLSAKLDSGQAVINLPVTFINRGPLDLSLTTSIQGLDDIRFTYEDQLLLLKPSEQKINLITLRINEMINTDTLIIKAFAHHESVVFQKTYNLPLKTLLGPWIKARKEQTTVLLAEKLQQGQIAPLVLEDYNKLPLDSFFMKQTSWSLNQGKISQDVKTFDKEKLFMIWIDPDPVINRNYFNAKRNTYSLLLKLINQDQQADGLEPKLIVERPSTFRSDTIVIALDQGVLLGSYQYNIQSDLRLDQGENKVKLTLWYRGVLIKSSSMMIINYQPPKSNLFVYAYGVPHPELAHVAKDARDMADAFRNQQGKLFSTVQTTVYNTMEATETQSIRKSIKTIANDYYDFKRIRKDDVILIYFSSHGSLINDEFHLHPSDYDPLYEEETTINLLRDVQAKLKDIPCKKLFFIDACHSGAAGLNKSANQGTKGESPAFDRDLADALIKLSEASNDFYYLLSSSAGEVSYTDAAWGNSAFTKGILEALADRSEATLDGIRHADTDGNKIIDLKELYDYIKERVPVIIQSKKDLKSSQTPYTPDVKALKNISIYVVNQ